MGTGTDVGKNSYMKKISFIVLSTFLILSGLNLPAAAVGSGALANQTGISARSLGFANAYAGVADDPSAIFFNPAGLTQVKGFRLMEGGAILLIQSEHTDRNGISGASRIRNDLPHRSPPARRLLEPLSSFLDAFA